MNEPMKVTFSQAISEQSATQKEILGALRVLNDGRKFRYCKNGGVALTVSSALKMPAADSDHVNESVAAAVAVGATSVTLTVAAAPTLNQYKDGYLQINDAAGEGQQYLIDGNTASTTCVIQLREPVRIALTTSSEGSLIPNPWSGVVVTSGAAIAPAGINPIAVTANYYFWCQTGGIAMANTGAGTPALGQRLTGAASGELALAAADGNPIFGFSYATVGVDTEFKPVILTID